MLGAAGRPVALAAALLLVSSMAAAQPKTTAETPLDVVWARLMAELEAASASLEPKRTPPKPVKLKWRTTRIASMDLKAPVLAIAVADIDGDKKAAELIALTTRELVVMKLKVQTYRRGGRLITRRRWVEAGRHALPTKQAAIMSRTPLGALIVANVDADEGLEILARSSTLARGAVFEWKNGRLVEQSRFDGFPLCANMRGRLSTGRNYFLSSRITWPSDAPRPSMPKRFYSASCVDTLVDPVGRKLSAFGRVATNGTLFVRFSKECGRRDETCKAKPTTELRMKGVGTAWAIADVNSDGVPEVITSGTRAPGMPDRVTVYSGAERLTRKYRRRFVGGVVGIAAGDIDGDGKRDAVAVVRILGATRVGTWLLNQ